MRWRVGERLRRLGRLRRIARAVAKSVMKAMNLMLPPQKGHNKGPMRSTPCCVPPAALKDGPAGSEGAVLLCE